MSFTAKYPGECGACEGRFRAGDEVEYDSSDQLVHVNCPDEFAEAGAVCPRCFLELPATGICSCDD